MLFERGWVIRQLGEENLTYYVVPMQLSFYIHAFISSIVLVVFPLASELKNNPEKLLRLYLKASKIVCFFVVFMATTFDRSKQNRFNIVVRCGICRKNLFSFNYSHRYI